jgi:CpXC motif protein
MSRSMICTFTCPCGEVFSSPIYDYINVAKDPQLQYTVLAGLLNVSTCPSCGRRAAIARPLIYSDPARHLLVYVHPRSDVPEEARLLILERLRTVYVDIVDGRSAGIEQHVGNGQKSNHALEKVKRNGTTEHLQAHQQQATEIPPLQVVFGLDQLNELINTTLSQDERLGRLALSTHSRNDAERGQLLTIARKLALEMGCQIEVEDLPDEYTVWLYGSRRQIGALMRELAPRG